jgi:hypothetical protein
VERVEPLDGFLGRRDGSERRDGELVHHY